MPTVLKGKEQFYKCAVEMLADTGYESVNIGRLCSSLGVTSGSFYHHFGSWDGFVEALIDFEENHQVAVLRQHNFGTVDAETDFTMLRDLTVSLNHRAEAALRAWSLSNDVVRAGMGRIDDRRYRTVFKVVREIVGTKKEATLLTDFGMAMVIGYQHMVVTGEVTAAKEMFDAYVRFVFSHKATRTRSKR